MDLLGHIVLWRANDENRENVFGRINNSSTLHDGLMDSRKNGICNKV